MIEHNYSISSASMAVCYFLSSICLIVLIERHLVAKRCAFNQRDSTHLVCVTTKSLQFCCIHSSSNLPSPPVALHWKEHPQHETATFTLYSRDVVRLVVSCLFPPDCFGLQMKTFFFFSFFIASLQRIALGVMLVFPAVSSLSTLTCRPASAALSVVIQNVPSQQTLWFCQWTLNYFHLSDRSPHCTVV